jgi:phosphoribosyl 1,2-cyclic phosphodiesterase
MRFSNKYSGSSGNLTLVDDGKTRLLIDCGGGIRSMKSALKKDGLSVCDIDGVLITHEHTDHVSALEPFLRANKKAKIYVHQKGFKALSLRLPQAEERFVPFDAPFFADGYFVEFYECSHDASFCCGYKVTEESGVSIATVTDTGKTDKQLISFFKGCHTVLIESNHDEVMLKQGNYPYPLKRRILGETGHLSNAQAAEVLALLPDINVRNVFLGHLSLENNTEEIAFSTALSSLGSVGAKEGKDINLYVARQFCGGESIIVKK